MQTLKAVVFGILYSSAGDMNRALKWQICAIDLEAHDGYFGFHLSPGLI